MTMLPQESGGPIQVLLFSGDTAPIKFPPPKFYQDLPLWKRPQLSSNPWVFMGWNLSMLAWTWIGTQQFFFLMFCNTNTNWENLLDLQLSWHAKQKTEVKTSQAPPTWTNWQATLWSAMWRRGNRRDFTATTWLFTLCETSTFNISVLVV